MIAPVRCINCGFLSHHCMCPEIERKRRVSTVALTLVACVFASLLAAAIHHWFHP